MNPEERERERQERIAEHKANLKESSAFRKIFADPPRTPKTPNRMDSEFKPEPAKTA